jgi:hypothetical protein
MYTTRTQALELLVSELQDDIKFLLPRFDVSVENGEQRLRIHVIQCDMEVDAFTTVSTGWHFDIPTMRLWLGDTHWELGDTQWGLDLHKTSLDGVIISIVPSWFGFEQPCSRHTLPLIVKRLYALDVPELSEDSRAALHQFLEAAAHILD